jgi:hypothetical protein
MRSLQDLDTEALRAYWTEARAQAAIARIKRAFAAKGLKEWQHLDEDVHRWEAQQADCEEELDARGAAYE